MSFPTSVPEPIIPGPLPAFSFSFKSCKKTVKTFEKFGVTAVHIEDQVERKRFGHLDNKELISVKKMVKKIEDCVKARKDNNFKIKNCFREIVKPLILNRNMK